MGEPTQLGSARETLKFLDRESTAYAEAVANGLQAILGENLVGVYLHGSAVLGDFVPKTSDVDMLAICSRALSAAEKRTIVERLSRASLPCPAAGLEFHVVECRTLQRLSKAPTFELHLDTSEGDRAIDGQDHGGDPDLLLHFAVLAEHGHALFGPKPSATFPRITRAWLLEAFVNELRWAEQKASPSYQVLNACRAWRFLEGGVLCSKVEGGEWARKRAADPSTIDAAMHNRRGLTEDHPDPLKAREVLQGVIEQLSHSL